MRKLIKKKSKLLGKKSRCKKKFKLQSRNLSEYFSKPTKL